MKLILDVGAAEWSAAMLAAANVMREFPQQKIGTGNGIRTMIRGQEFVVVRNQGSYTVKNG